MGSFFNAACVFEQGPASRRQRQAAGEGRSDLPALVGKNLAEIRRQAIDIGFAYNRKRKEAGCERPGCGEGEERRPAGYPTGKDGQGEGGAPLVVAPASAYLQ